MMENKPLQVIVKTSAHCTFKENLQVILHKEKSYSQDLEGSISPFMHLDSFTLHAIPQNVPTQVT